MLRSCLIWSLVGFAAVASIATFGFLVIAYGLIALFVLFL